MANHRALHLALDLARTPVLARMASTGALPEGMLFVIRVAAGCEEAVAEAAGATSDNPDTVRTAAQVFLQQTLFAAPENHYRTLGVKCDASRTEIAEHAKWLLRWLHPDHDAAGWDSLLAGRILAAWQELKQPRQRARYDAYLASRRPRGRNMSAGRRRWARKSAIPLIRTPVEASRSKFSWALCGALGLIVLIAVLLFGGRFDSGYTIEKVSLPDSAQAMIDGRP